MRFATKKSGKAKDLEREALRVITKSCMITAKEMPSPLSIVWCVVVVSIKETSGVLKVLLENVIRDAVTYTERLADTFRYERKSSTRQLLLQDKVRNDNARYKVKRHCLLQDIFSKKTLSVPTFSVETLLVVRHFQLLIKKTLSVMRYFLFSDTCSCQTLAVFRHLQLSDTFSYQTLAVVRHFQLSDTCSYQTLCIMRHFL